MTISVQELSPPTMRFFVAQLVLRFLTALSTAVAICVVVNSADVMVVFGVTFLAKYNYSSAFRFLVGADALVLAFVLVTLIVVYYYYAPKQDPTLDEWFFLFLIDLVLLVLMISACGAATAVGYIGLKGQEETAWYKICDRVPRFCNRVGVSLGFSYVACLCLFALTIMCCYKLKSHATAMS